MAINTTTMIRSISSTTSNQDQAAGLAGSPINSNVIHRRIPSTASTPNQAPWAANGISASPSASPAANIPSAPAQGHPTPAPYITSTRKSSTTTFVILGIVRAFVVAVIIIGLRCYFGRSHTSRYGLLDRLRVKCAHVRARASVSGLDHHHHRGVDNIIFHPSSPPMRNGVRKGGDNHTPAALTRPSMRMSGSAAAVVASEGSEMDGVLPPVEADDGNPALIGGGVDETLTSNDGKALVTSRTPPSEIRQGRTLHRDERTLRIATTLVQQGSNGLSDRTPVKSDRPLCPNTFGMAQAVIEAAERMAQASSVPGISEAASLLGVFLKLSADHQHNAKAAEQRARWCRSIVVLLEKAEEILSNVSFRMLVENCPCLLRSAELTPRIFSATPTGRATRLTGVPREFSSMTFARVS